MTRKHFILLAEAIATISDEQERTDVTRLIANVCQKSNQRFNRSKFINYVEEQNESLNVGRARYERTYPE